MVLTSGTRLGSYEILGIIGAGGMGEVYRARDINLGRQVAVKVLPDAVSHDANRLARFDREARVLAALNHANIAHVHGLEKSAGTMALVMELVEGPTLADRIAVGPVPIPEALAIARQIAEALEAAHDQGIVHRDLKPANIKVRPDGAVKVLDFGLAKALDPAAAAPAEQAEAETLTSPAVTEIGTILGTAAYMAPEQARGKPADRRADIWAFGCVLYEMLTGRRAFPGSTVAETLAAVIHGEPNWTALPPDLDPAVRGLLERCLQRDPKWRLQAIGEARIALTTAPDRIEPEPSRGRWSPARVGALLALVAAVGSTGYLARGYVTRTEPAPFTHKLDVAVDGLEVTVATTPAISPDGRRLVYSASGQLWIRPLDEFSARPLGGSERAQYPFWSPDSREVAFIKDGKLWRTAVDGTTPALVGSVPADMTGSGGGAWTTDGTLVVSGSDSLGLVAFPLTGGAGRELIPIDKSTEADFHEVSALPTGGVLFAVHHRTGADAIDAFVDGRRRRVFEMTGETLRSPVYAASGYLLFARESTSPGVWAVRFSLDRLTAEGTPFLVVPNGQWVTAGAHDTVLVVRPSGVPSQLVTVDRHGTVAPIATLQGQLLTVAPYSTMTSSPDGRRLAMALTDGGASQLWIHDLAGGGGMSRLTVNARFNVNPTWAPDGSRLFFADFADRAKWNVLSVPSTAAAPPQRVLAGSEFNEWPCSVSPDGKWLVFARQTPSDIDLWLARLDTPDEPPRQLMQTPFRESDARFSPDGHWLAYTSDETGVSDVYVRAFPLDGQRTQISSGGGVVPAWSSDGQELFFRTTTALMSARLHREGAGLVAAPAGKVFDVTSDARLSLSFAVSRDSKQFYLVRSPTPERISVIQPWAGSRVN